MARIDDEGLEGLAELIKKLNPNQQKKLERLMHAKAKGIKKTKRVQKISLGSEDLVVGEEEENTRLSSDGSIVHSQVSKRGLYDCKHAITPDNFGHEAECGHTVCKECAERWDLVCAVEGCLNKLCTVNGCSRRVIEGRNVCREHVKWVKARIFCQKIGFLK